MDKIKMTGAAREELKNEIVEAIGFYTDTCVELNGKYRAFQNENQNGSKNSILKCISTQYAAVGQTIVPIVDEILNKYFEVEEDNGGDADTGEVQEV